MFQDLDAIYARYRQAENIPGLVYGVIQGGKLAHVKGLGIASLETKAPVEAETFFRIASMTKCVTSLAVLLLRDRGRLSLDATVESLVPGFAKLLLPTADSRPVTLRDLLTHVAGFVTDDPWGDRLLAQPLDEFNRMLEAGMHFARPPRIDFEYSNLGYTVLGRVVEAASGDDYTGFVTREILRPIGMERSTFEIDDLPAGALALGYRHHDDTWSAARLEHDGAFGAMAGICTNAVEYGRFVAFMLDAWPSRDAAETGPVSRASRRELALLHSGPRAPTFRKHQGREIATASAYGYGLINSFEPELGRYLHHRGGLPGYGSHFLFSPETQIGIFSFANRTYAAMNEPNVEAAAALKDAGAWTVPPLPVSAHLATAVEAVSRVYRAGRIAEAKEMLAINFLLDRPAEEWDRHLSLLAERVGELRHIDAIPDHQLSAKLTLTGERGVARGDLILTGERSPRIQSLTLEFAKGA
ncbi:serine hydrolase domain-containing protein [Dongia sedimenti]|uniref:Serine hydrolase domain-containing protein n=1 Tax=Dongia sedimenti TaxID=3064282 RepID=A0ABU0YJN9_9PROT|nr:serine hydrolase domain-containing protein [Rhodospirillaceae bacterium R-7]